MRSPLATDDITAQNVGTLRCLVETLPARYDDKWYLDLVGSQAVAQLGYFQEVPVGAVRAHMVLKLSTPTGVYVDALVVLPAYRGKGLGKMLLDWVEKEAKDRFVHEVALHVRAGDGAARAWYERQGYVLGEVVQGYYAGQGLDPADAVTMTKTV